MPPPADSDAPPAFGPGLTPPIAFAEPRELTAEDLWRSPARTPRPSRLQEPLNIKPPTAAAAAESIGLETVGDLLAHLPRATGEARTIAELALDETATVLVEVKSITSRPVRRRGMKPLVEATVSRRHRDHEGHVLQPAVAVGAVPDRHAADAGRQVPGQRPLPRQRPRQDRRGRGDRRRGRRRGQYPATKGISSTQLLALVQQHRRRDLRRHRPAAGRAAPSRCSFPTDLPRLPPRTSATTRAAAAAWPSTSCCSTRSSSCACATSAAPTSTPRR